MGIKMNNRIGRQTPTQSFILPYKETKGAEAVELYNRTGRTAQEWQELIIYDMLATNKDGLWTHTKFGWSVPRRNGKNEVAAIRELYGLKCGEHILHTAHRTTTSHTAWERLCALLEKLGYEEVSRKKKDEVYDHHYTSFKAYGLENIVLLDGSGGIINFRTRSSKGGLGEGYDLLVIDEAQEYQDDQESALKYVVTDSKNPQTIMLGTPPTPVSSGTVFTKTRASILSGEATDGGWAEWSVQNETDPHDRDAWYETNPSLGTIFTERSVADEIGTDAIDFNIQRLGLWIRYSQKSAISQKEWETCKVSTLPKLSGPMYVGVKYNTDGQSVSLAIAVKTAEESTFTECIDCRNVRAGLDWITAFCVSACPRKIVIDGASGQRQLEDALIAAKVKKNQILLPTVKDVIVANAKLEPMIEAQTIQHMGQPALVQSVTNAEHRAIGSNGGYGYKTLKAGVDSSLMDAMLLAVWAADEFSADPRKQKVDY